MLYRKYSQLLRLLMVAAFLGACSGGSLTEPEALPVGNYQLQMVNGQALPFAFIDTELERGEILDGSLALQPDGTYHWSISLQWVLGVAPNEVQVFTRSGNYEYRGNELRLLVNSDKVDTGSVNGEVVVVVVDVEGANGLSYTFRRAPGG
jgi:hypothetical protein